MNEASFSPFALTGFRILTGCLVFFALYMIFVREKIDTKDLPLILACGLTGVGINMTLFLLGLHYTTPINASLVMTLTPILVVVFSMLILREKLSLGATIGIFLALCGAVVLIYRPSAGFSFDSIKGDLYIFLNSASYAMYLVLVKKLTNKYKPFTILMLVFTVACCTIFPFSIPDIMAIEWSALSTSTYMAFAFVLLCTTCMTYLFNIFALGIVKSSTAGSYIYLQPVIASIFAILLKEDVLNLKTVVCTAVIFLGLYLVGRKKQKK